MFGNIKMFELYESLKKHVGKSLLFAVGVLCSKSCQVRSIHLQKTFSALSDYTYMNQILDQNCDSESLLKGLESSPSNIKLKAFLLRFNNSADHTIYSKVKEIVLRKRISPNYETFDLMLKSLGNRYVNLYKINEIGNKEVFSTLCTYFDYELTEIINYFSEENVYININIQNCILEILINLKRDIDAWNNYLSMKLSFIPNEQTFGIMLNGLFNQEEISNELLDIGLQLLEESKDLYKPTEKVLRVLHNACTKYKSMEKVEGISKLLREKEIFDENSYVSLIKAYGKSYNIEKANEAIEEMRRNINPSLITYETLIKVLLKCKAIDKCEKLFEELTERKLENHTVVSILLNGYKENKLFEKAVKLYDEFIIFNSRLDESQNLNNFNTLLECCIQLNRKDLIEELYVLITRNINCIFRKIDSNTFLNLLKVMEEDSDKIKEIFYLVQKRTDQEGQEELLINFLKLFIKKDDEENVQKVHSLLQTKCVKLSITFYEYLASFYSKDSTKSYSLFDELIKYDIQPTLEIYQSLIKTQLNADYIDRAITIYKNMKFSKVHPDFMLYDLIIKSCLKFKRVKESAEVTVSAIKQNIILEDSIYCKVIDEILSEDSIRISERIELMTNLTEELKKNNISVHQTIKEKTDKFIYSNTQFNGNLYHTSLIYNTENSSKKEFYNPQMKFQRNANPICFTQVANTKTYYNRQYNKQPFTRNENSLYSAKIY